MVLETFESPLDCKIKQPILKEIDPEYPLERLMLKLKLQYFSHLMQSELMMDREVCMLQSMWS